MSAPFQVGDAVRVRTAVMSGYSGLTGVVTSVKKRRRGPKTTRTSYDYQVCIGVVSPWFLDNELESLRGGETA